MTEKEKQFEIRGMRKEKGKERAFTKIVAAPTEHFALEKLMSQMGSKHGTLRRNIVIQEMKEQKGEAKK